MRKVQTPNGRDVDVADILIRYKGMTTERAMSVVVDDDLAINIGSYIEKDPAWENWDLNYYFFLTRQEWRELNNVEPISDEWEIVGEWTEVTA